MQDRPTAAELLDTIAEVLETQVLAETEGGTQHAVRVAANLCRILERENRLGPEIEAREQQLLRALLGSDSEDLLALNRALDLRLALESDPAFAARAWKALVEIARDKLRVAKPGYDTFDFRDELDSDG